MEPQATGEITAKELEAYLEGEIELEDMSKCFETILTWLKKTKNEEATIVITIKNDLAEQTERD